MSVHSEMDRIIAEIAECARDPFVERHIGRPNTPVFFVKVLYLLLTSFSLPAERIRLHCVATTLLQMGLDMHERVSVGSERTEEGIRSRQLFVLAGDYFSSLFYRFLAEKGEIRTISRLSGAICEVNEAKMDLYALIGCREVSPASYIGLIRRIRGSLPVALSELFHQGKASDNPWPALAPDLAVLEWMVDERTVYPGVPSALQSAEARAGLIRATASAARQKASAIAHPEARRELLRIIDEQVDSYLQEPLVREG